MGKYRWPLHGESPANPGANPEGAPQKVRDAMRDATSREFECCEFVRAAHDPPEAPEGRWQINEMASRGMDYLRIAEMLGDPFRSNGGGLSGWAARAAHPRLH
jgi:hypothetical protein